MSIKINRLEEGHNSCPLVCRRPAETVSLHRRHICYRWGTPAYWSLDPRSSMFYLKKSSINPSQTICLRAVNHFKVIARSIVIILVKSTMITKKMLRRVWRYRRGNQNPYIEEEQKIKDWETRSTKHTHKTKMVSSYQPLIYIFLLWSQSGNHKPSIEERQTMERPKKDKRTHSDLQNTTQKIKDWETRSPLSLF